MSEEEGLTASSTDTWLQEAEEASKLIQDIEMKIKDPTEKHRFIARLKLMELGTKLDRLDSLLRNPPLKPVLTDSDIEFRRIMLSEIQLRTRSVAVSLYSRKSKNRLQSQEDIALRHLQLEEECERRRQTKEDEKIMEKDINGLPPMQWEYFLARQREIDMVEVDSQFKLRRK